MDAPHFADTLSHFLHQEGIAAPPAALLQFRYPLYKKFSRTLPSLRGRENDVFDDTVFALPLNSRHASKCSTLLYIEDPTQAESIGVKGEYISSAECVLCSHVCLVSG